MQPANNILLVRPSGFVFNSQTAASNAFQRSVEMAPEGIACRAKEEFDAFAARLRSEGLNVFVFDDTDEPPKPDAVFPNNWITFHADGTVILYPMQAPNRRSERRMDIIESLKRDFEIGKIIDLSVHEKEDRFLEGTGSIVFDHLNQVAYACLSPRTDRALFTSLCGQIGYRPHYFRACDRRGQPIYHTNVMMCLGAGFAVVCPDSITDEREAKALLSSLSGNGHEVICISSEQMERFAGNMLCLSTHRNEILLALSESAYASLHADQRSGLEKYARLLPLAIPTIETVGGGSVRCMIAEIFCRPR
ncbi:MAG: citrulline utilization hydrolase CtlX [Bacteroidota bacterium]